MSDRITKSAGAGRVQSNHMIVGNLQSGDRGRKASVYLRIRSAVYKVTPSLFYVINKIVITSLYQDF